MTGLATKRVACQNNRASAKVSANTSDPKWDCEALGLVVQVGDTVQTSVKGVVVEGSGHVAGSVTRMAPAAVSCQNITTGAKLQVTTGATSWDCEAMGLVVSPGDIVVTGATGTAR